MANPVASAATVARRKLGRGLGSLISAPVQIETTVAPDRIQHSDTTPTSSKSVLPSAELDAGTQSAGVVLIPVALVHPNPKQPRQHFDEEALRLLAGSIAASGLMQPIVVRPVEMKSAANVGTFQIIAGERRWRAAQIAGLINIPAVVREVDDRAAAELALVENLQREDLNPMERAEAFRRLIQDFGLTHHDIAQQVGLDRSSVTNHLRLHELDDFTKDAVRRGDLSLGHAKVLLGITNITARSAFAGTVVNQGWSVRELERRIKAEHTDSTPGLATNKTLSSPGAANTMDLERRLGEHLGTKVHLQQGRTKGAGRLIIEFYSLDQFEGLMRQIQYNAD